MRKLCLRWRRAFVAGALVVAAVCLWCIETVAMEFSHPGGLTPAWGIVYAGAVALIIACGLAARSATWAGRLVLGGAMAVCVLVLNDIVGFRRAAEMNEWPVSPMPPAGVWATSPSRRPVATQSAGDLVCTVDRLERDREAFWYEIVLRTRSSGDLAARYNPFRATFVPTTLVGRRVRSTGGSVFLRKGRGASNEALVRDFLFPAAGVTECDLTVTVPEWPSRPAASLEVAIPTKAPVAASGGGVGITVSSARPMLSTSSDPMERVIRLAFDLRGYSGSWDETVAALRVTDGDGATLPLQCYTANGDGSGRWRVAAEAWPASRRLRALRVDLFAPAQMHHLRHVFEFRRLQLPSKGLLTR